MLYLAMLINPQKKKEISPLMKKQNLIDMEGIVT